MSWLGVFVAVVLATGSFFVLTLRSDAPPPAGPPARVGSSPSPDPSPGVSATAAAPPGSAPTATAAPAPTPLPPVELPEVVKPLGPGASGADVVAFQQRLAALHYMVGDVDGRFGSATEFAVTAFQKVEKLQRSGTIDPVTRSRMQSAAIPHPDYASPPDHIEVDIARQVLFVVQGGQVSTTVAVSTGTGKKFVVEGRTSKAITPNGVFTVLWKYDGWWTSPLGELYKPAFIDDRLGIAIHGYPSVPSEPASHGCIRVPLMFQDWMYAHATPRGLTVFVHGGPDGPNP